MSQWNMSRNIDYFCFWKCQDCERLGKSVAKVKRQFGSKLAAEQVFETCEFLSLSFVWHTSSYVWLRKWTVHWTVGQSCENEKRCLKFLLCLRLKIYYSLILKKYLSVSHADSNDVVSRELFDSSKLFFLTTKYWSLSRPEAGPPFLPSQIPQI